VIIIDNEAAVADLVSDVGGDAVVEIPTVLGVVIVIVSDIVCDVAAADAVEDIVEYIGVLSVASALIDSNNASGVVFESETVTGVGVGGDGGPAIIKM